MSTRLRVRVRGAGIVGLAVAAELLRRGHEVEVVDRAPGSGASGVAAGMLAPAAEATWAAPGVLELGRRSLGLWPGFAALLGVPLPRGGTLLVGHDLGDLLDVRRQATLLDRPAEALDPDALRDLEPGLGRVAGGLLLLDDHRVDPREVLAALAARVPVVPAPGGRAPDVTVLATGARLPAPYSGLVRPVRGEVLRLRVAEPPGRTVRGWVAGEPVYVVPRPGGEVVVGATVEEHDGPPVVTAEGVRRLLSAATTLLPGLDRAEVVELAARDRPGTVDDLPLVGPTLDPSVVLAAGHFRHGVLLAPLTAQLVADHLEHGSVHPLTDPRRLLEER